MIRCAGYTTTLPGQGLICGAIRKPIVAVTLFTILDTSISEASAGTNVRTGGGRIIVQISRERLESSSADSLRNAA